MGVMASQITGDSIVYSTVYSGADQRKHQSSAPLAFVMGIHRWPVNSPHKGPVTRKMLPFDDVIIWDQMGLFMDMENPSTSAAQLREALLKAWDAVIPDRMEVLLQGMPRRQGLWWMSEEAIPDINLKNSNSTSSTIFLINSILIITLHHNWFLSIQHFAQISNFLFARVSYKRHWGLYINSPGAF